MSLLYTPPNIRDLIIKYRAVYYLSNNTPSEVTKETIGNERNEQEHNEEGCIDL